MNTQHESRLAIRNQRVICQLNLFPSFILAVSLLILLAISGMGSRTATAGDIAQLPLFLNPPVSPNIMFLLDDSGSMMFEILPDEHIYGSVYYLFPRSDGVYGSSDYSNNVATIADKSAFTALVRSSSFNKSYYNPSVTYEPWSRADKTLYPNANPDCALHNPERSDNTTDYCRNLVAYLTTKVDTTEKNTAIWYDCSHGHCDSGTTKNPNLTFWPATYFTYQLNDGGAGKWRWDNYKKVEIKSTTTTYSGEGRSSRTDCMKGTCTYAQEIQNFSNWYTYYRSRILAARAGIGRAFAKQPFWADAASSKLRVGFGAINNDTTTVDGVDTKAVIQGVRDFYGTTTGTGRYDFFTSLYTHPISAKGTPLRRALDAVGQYYSRTDGKGPWSKTPGTLSTEFASCRQSYTILMTNGYWTEGPAYAVENFKATGNTDNENGPTINGPDGQSFTYFPVSPFKDDNSDTLADIAMYYWKRDINASIENRVPVTNKDPAFWQHMVTFGISLGNTGNVNPDQAFAAIETQTSIPWQNPYNPQQSDSNCKTDNLGHSCAARLDDLLHASVNSRGSFFSAADPNTFSNKLADALDSINVRQESAATSLSSNSTSLKADSQLFQARFTNRGSNWVGELLAYTLDNNGTMSTSPIWTTHTAGKIPVHTSRVIFTALSNAESDKVAFNWSDLSVTQQTTLASFGITQDVLNWIRGDQTKEEPNGGFRKRTDPDGNTRLLGDIIHSDPIYVAAPPNFGYSAWPGYTAFRTDKKDRTKMLYAGANDGMLHAFDASTGVEKFAFIPKASYTNLASLTKPDYKHKYFVDGPAYVADAAIGTHSTTAADNWRSVLLGTMGAGGRSVFALDVTDPVTSDGTVKFNAANILWEFTDEDLGYTFSRPTVGRLQNGTWVAIFGNGYGSTNYDAYLYVVNLQTGELIARLGTGTSVDGLGDATTPNGLSTPVLLGDAHRNIIAAYAGDLKGNLWKFDLTGTLTKDTPPAFKAPLFKARDANGKMQPITAPPEIGKHPNGGYLIFFGTGKYFETTDKEPDTTASNISQINSLYGIWDQQELNGTTWTEASAITTIDRSVLQQQFIQETATVSDKNWRVVSQNTITWTGTDAKRGWYLDLSAQSEIKADDLQDLSERVIDAAILDGGRAIFTTRIQVKAADPCNPLSGTGWLMVLDMVTGGRKEDVFDVNSSGTIDSRDRATQPAGDGTATLISVSGFQSTVGMPGGVPTLLSKANGLITFYLPGQPAIATGDIGGSEHGPSRLSWRQLR